MSSGSVSSYHDYELRRQLKLMNEKIESLESKIDLLVAMLERRFPSEQLLKELEKEIV